VLGMIGSTTLLAMLLASGVQLAAAEKKPVTAKPVKIPLPELVEKHFAHWDRDHDDVLDLSEVDHVIEDHSVHARQAALVVCLRHHLTKKGNAPFLTHQELLKLVEQPGFAKTVERTATHLETIDRELFLPTDPNLATFSQGGLGDCYLLAAIAAQVHRSPKAIRDMIHPEVTGGFRVVFGDGRKIEVPPLTDSELLLGANLDSRHGSWLAVLEKSYGIIRKRDRAKTQDKAARARLIVPEETMGSGHLEVTLSLLTGRQTEVMHLGPSSHRERVHNVLVETTKKRRLVCVDTTNDKAPPGMGKRHSYAILGYDEHKRQVTVFNPWGNNFTPKGPAGTANGYATKNGVFTVPLDQFQKVFSDLAYETGRPLKK
jgi:hypothetical protein